MKTKKIPRYHIRPDGVISSDLKRYNAHMSGMNPNDNGRWVEYEDVKSLLKDLQKLSIETSSYGAWMVIDNEGDYYYVTDVESLFLTDFTLKNDSKRHNMVFKGINITYRLSVKKTHFWIYNKDTDQEIQYIIHDSGSPDLHGNWKDFMSDFWNEILEDMM